MNMAFKKLIFIFFIWKSMENGNSFNPMLTYTLRFHKMTLIPNISGNYTIDQYREKQFINAKVINPIKNITKDVVTFLRCNPEGANCEYFQSWTMTDICEKLKEKNQIWSRWYSSYTPSLECPIDKVNYKITNATVDIGVILTMYPEATEYRWKVIQHFYNNDDLVGGFMLETSMFGYRKRTKAVLKH